MVRGFMHRKDAVVSAERLKIAASVKPLSLPVSKNPVT